MRAGPLRASLATIPGAAPPEGGSGTEGARTDGKARGNLGCRDRCRRSRVGRVRVVIAEFVSTSTTAIAPAAALATGTYAPAGASGTPHYVITISSAENTEFDGAMHFVYQDGTTSHVFDFSGKVMGQSAMATPTNVAAPGSGTQTVSSVPDALRIDIGADTLTFEGCQAYLPLVRSLRACTFVGSR